MNLTEQMNDDLDLFLDVDEHGESCVFLPKGVEPGDTAQVLCGDAQGSAGGDQVLTVSATPRIMGRLSQLRAIILAQEGTARDPASGDQFRFGNQIATVIAPELERADSDAVWLSCSIAVIDGLSAGRRT